MQAFVCIAVHFVSKSAQVYIFTSIISRSISTKAPFEVSATKPALTPVSVRSKDRNSFISRQVTMRYSCSPLGTNEMVLYACVAVVQGDEVTAGLKNGEAKSESREGVGSVWGWVVNAVLLSRFNPSAK